MNSEDDSSAPGRQPISCVLNGLEIYPLLPTDTLVEAFILVKVLDADGATGWRYRTTSTPNRKELLGALATQIAVLRRSRSDPPPTSSDQD